VGGSTSTGTSSTSGTGGTGVGTTTSGAGTGVGGTNDHPKGGAGNLVGGCTCRLTTAPAENERAQGGAFLLALAASIALRARRRPGGRSSSSRN
jgi:hypothetical protein